jgi:hypothetical protein
LDEQPDDQADLVIHSFVIRIWFDDANQGAGAPVWRGQITHIPGGERRYFNDIAEIPILIGQHLNAQDNSRNSPTAVP